MEENSLLQDLRRDVEFTATNYSQMYKRLNTNDVASRFFTTYYSAFAILCNLLPLFFEEKLASRQILDFLLLSSSIVVLVVSLMISFAKYSERSHQVMIGLNQMKRLKKELAIYSDTDLKADNCKKYLDFVDMHHQIVDHIELRADIDYYHACKILSVKENCKNSWQSLPCLNKAAAYLWPAVKYLFYIVLFMLPVALVAIPGVILR